MYVGRKIVLVIMVSVFLVIGVSAGGLKEEKPLTLQMIYEQMSEDIPAAAIMDCQYSERVDAGIVSACMDDMLEYFIHDNVFRPFSVNNWLSTEYKKNARNVCEIADAIKKVELPVEYMISCSVNKLSDIYEFSATVISLKESVSPQYFNRSFYSIEQWDKIKHSLFYEIKSRSKKVREAIMPYSVFVEEFPIRLFQYVSLKTGEFEFVEVPLSHINFNDFKKNEDILQKTLVYDFHSNGIISVIADDLNDYHNGKKYPSAYVISGEMLITDRMNLLNFSLYDVRDQKKIKLVDFSYPFKDISVTEMRALSRQVVNAVYDQLLTPEQAVRLSYQDLNFSIRGEEIFYDGCFLHTAVQKQMCLPVGCNWFSIHHYVDEEFADTNNPLVAFVSPIDNEMSLHNGTEGKYLEKLLAQKGL